MVARNSLLAAALLFVLGSCGLIAPFSDLPPRDAGDDEREMADIQNDENIDMDEKPPHDAPSHDCTVREATSDNGDCRQTAIFTNAFKMTLYNVGMDGHPGSGLDMDGNSSTCSPGQGLAVPACSGGIDNGLALLGAICNQSLDTAIEDGTMNIIVVLTDMNNFGCPFYLDHLTGVLQSGDPGCAQEPGCAYSASISSFDQATCLPLSTIGNAFLDGTTLTAGGDEFVYLFDAVVVGLHVVIPVLRPRVQAQAQVQVDGWNIVDISGILGGIVRKEDFIGAFEAIPGEQYSPAAPKDVVIQMWRDMYASGQIEMDFDLDGDTVPESSSIGIPFNAVCAVVSGVH
jgi:hypothetical protein